MASTIEGRYQLKALHEEIDLFDRKLAHLLKYDVFPSDSARAAAAKKLNTKREVLVKTAKQLASEGVEFKPNELPRSFRDKDTPMEIPVDSAVAVDVLPESAVTGAIAGTKNRQAPAFAGTALDWRKSVQEYIDKSGRGKFA